MQNTSQLWKSIWDSGEAWLESEAIIAGVTYQEISNPVINRALVQGGLSIGNAVSATCSFTVRTDDTIPKSAEVVIRQRLHGSNVTSEWLDAGTFYISHRMKDPVTGLLSLECYDALLKANSEMPAYLPWTDNNGNVMTTRSGEWLYFSAAYPLPMGEVLTDLLLVLGIELDERTTIATGADYIIDDVGKGTTINDVLKRIAAANGGNWIMTPNNKLRLVPVISASGAAAATENVVDVVGVTGAINLGGTSQITGIRYTVDNEAQLVGNETGIVLDADVPQSVAETLGTQLIGKTYQAYDLRGAIYDPAAELGDYVRGGANGEVSAVLYSETATLGVAYRGDISAPEVGDLADEYPYFGGTGKAMRLAQDYADRAAQQATEELDESLDQKSIFKRLTSEGKAAAMALDERTEQISINADYIAAGTIPPERIGSDSITADKIAAKAVTADKIAAGAVTADSIAAGAVTADKIEAGAITADKIAAKAISGDKISAGIISSLYGDSHWDLTTGEFVNRTDNLGVSISDAVIQFFDYEGDVTGYIDGRDHWLNIDGESVVIGDVTGQRARIGIANDSVSIYGDIVIEDATAPNTGLDTDVAAGNVIMTFAHGVLVDVTTTASAEEVEIP